MSRRLRRQVWRGNQDRCERCAAVGPTAAEHVGPVETRVVPTGCWVLDFGGRRREHDLFLAISNPPGFGELPV
jgi:hypothetical protein